MSDNIDDSVTLEPEKDIKFSRALKVENTEATIYIAQYFLCDEPSVVWDAALALSYYLDKLQMKSSYLSNKNVIELGSGTGIVGLFASALGANVVMTDVPKVIPLIEHNIEVNSNFLQGSAEARELIWGETVLNINTPDIILVSDCVYYEEGVDKLIATLIGLADKNTEIFIAYEKRLYKEQIKIMEDFLKKLKDFFSIIVIPRSEQHSTYSSNDIFIIKCQKL